MTFIAKARGAKTKHTRRKPNPVGLKYNAREKRAAWNRDLIAAFQTIHEHAVAMAGKTAAINDKTIPIRATCAAMLARLGVAIGAHAKSTSLDPLDIGQGEGCEGGKCAVPERK